MYRRGSCATGSPAAGACCCWLVFCGCAAALPSPQAAPADVLYVSVLISQECLTLELDMGTDSPWAGPGKIWTSLHAKYSQRNSGGARPDSAQHQSCCWVADSLRRQAPCWPQRPCHAPCRHRHSRHVPCHRHHRCHCCHRPSLRHCPQSCMDAPVDISMLRFSSVGLETIM